MPLQAVMSVHANRLVPLGALLLLAGVPVRRAHPAADGPFRIDVFARPSLRTLWDASVVAGAERVACIGGHTDAGITHITRVAPVEATADSTSASATASLAECRPPEWFGTVHTHIARYQGAIPYSTFSGADRGVMRAWHARWRDDGVFCLLYDERRAYCEAGTDRGGDVAYAAPSGGNMAP